MLKTDKRAGWGSLIKKEMFIRSTEEGSPSARTKYGGVKRMRQQTACLPHAHTQTCQTILRVTWSAWWHRLSQLRHGRARQGGVSLNTLSCRDNQHCNTHVKSRSRKLKSQWINSNEHQCFKHISAPACCGIWQVRLVLRGWHNDHPQPMWQFGEDSRLLGTFFSTC